MTGRLRAYVDYIFLHLPVQYTLHVSRIANRTILQSRYSLVRPNVYEELFDILGGCDLTEICVSRSVSGHSSVTSLHVSRHISNNNHNKNKRLKLTEFHR